MHQPTLAEATTAAENVINNFVAALDTVEHARAMPREAKRILQDEILHSPKPVNAAWRRPYATPYWIRAGSCAP